MRLLAHGFKGIAWRLLMVTLMVFCTPKSARAATPEKLLLTTAYSYFNDKFYAQAEVRFSEFAAIYTNSPDRLSAIIYQSRCRLYQSNFVGAIDLLRSQLPAAGDMEDQFHYWIGESLLEEGSYKESAEIFSNLLAVFPNSRLSVRLPAAFGEAQVYAKMADWKRVIELLSKPDGAFQVMASKLPQSDSVVSGCLLLAEAYLARQQFADAERVVLNIKTEGVDAKLAWHRQFLLCRILLASGRAEDALKTCTNQLFLLAARQPAQVMADSVFLKGEIFEKLGRYQDAVDVYTNNFSGKASPSVQRLALFKTINLTLKQNRLQEAMRQLEYFAEQRTNDPSQDLARLMLGELALKAYMTSGDSFTNSQGISYQAIGTNIFISGTNIVAMGTNLLVKAMTNFSRMLQDFPASPLRGKAWLDLGWCWWAQGKYAEAGTNFQSAVDALAQQPTSTDSLIARFKVADTEFNLHNYDAAATNYMQVLELCDTGADLNPALYNKALFQVLRASMEREDSAMADKIIKKIIARHPITSFDEQSLLLFGEYKSRRQNGAEAREILNDLIKRFPKSQMVPEAQFAIARTYAMEEDWNDAADAYAKWAVSHPNHPLVPQAEFSRALACDKGGNETNAFILFTNFVARFPSNNLAALAQNWVADFYFNKAEYTDADLNYQELLRPGKFPGAGDLVYQARLMSGRSAFARQGPLDIEAALKSFSALADDTNAPPALVAKAYFALGETYYLLFNEKTDPTNRYKYCDAAVNAFCRITNSSSGFAPLAMGRIGDCYLEWARKIPTPEGRQGLTNAAEVYRQVLAMPQASVSARSQALVQLGTVAELQTNYTAALDYYLKVLYETEPGRFDPVWVNQAGVAAARLCESRGQWEQAINVYNRVLSAIPTLRPILEKKISAAMLKIEAAKK